MGKTTKADFSLFKKRVIQWCNFLGLSEWRKDFHHVVPQEDESGWRAWTTYGGGETQVGVALSMDWGNEEATTESIENAGRHESLEILTSELDTLAKNRYVTEEAINKVRHSLIYRMENTFCKIVDELFRIYPASQKDPNKLLEILKKR